MAWITSQIDDGYEFLKEGKNIACGGGEKIEDYKQDEAGCKNKCDADENCTYLWKSSVTKKCILYSSCDTKVNYPLPKGKMFKKKLDWNSTNMKSIVQNYFEKIYLLLKQCHVFII